MNDKKANLLQFFKTISPMEFLHELGAKLEENVNIINALQNYGIPDEVINVIISYVSYDLKDKFNHNYTITIATSLVMANISTAEGAMEYIKKSKKVNENIRKFL